MNKVISLISSNIERVFSEYSSKISDKYNIDINELKEIWDTMEDVSVNDGIKKPDNIKIPTSSKKTVSKASSVSSSKVSTPRSTNSSDKCSYKFIKGKQQGCFCTGSTKNGNKYCSKHLKFENEGQKEKKAPIPVVEKKSLDRIIKLNKDIKMWWHLETKLVFKSSTEKIVIGRCKDGEFQKLTEYDIEDCQKYGFKYELENPEETKEAVEPEKETKKVLEPEKETKKTVEPEKETKKAVKTETETKKSVKPEIKIKKIEQKPVNKVSIKEQIDHTNIYAKNVEDVISDMLNSKDDIDDSDNESQKDEEEEEELLDEEEDY